MPIELFPSKLPFLHMLKPGTPAPDFALQDQNGQSFRLKDHLGQNIIVLFFYPRDETGGCTREVCSFRDHFEEFRQAGCEVIGVSRDNVASHQNFVRHHRLPFALLSDPDNKVRKQYGATGKLFGLLPGRVTFIIDREGKIVHTFDSLFVAERHVEEALEVVRQLSE